MEIRMSFKLSLANPYASSPNQHEHCVPRGLPGRPAQGWVPRLLTLWHPS